MSTQKVIVGLVAGTIALGIGIAVQAPVGGLRRVVTGGGAVLGGSGTTSNPLTFTVHTTDGWHGTGSNGSALSLVPEWDAGWFGYGTDGVCNFDGSTVVAGITPAANVYLLPRDIYCTVTDIDGGITVNTGGYRLLSKVSLNNDGTISRVGNSSTSNTAAPGLSSGTLWGSAAGGAGGAASGGASGNSLPRRWKDHGGTGGAGGNSTFSVGAGGGALGTAMAATNGDFSLTYYAMTAQTTNGSTSSSFTISAGGGGGAGVGNGSCIGTGGGGGGGATAVFSPVFTGTGLITVKGGGGANCSVCISPVCGGGGGGMGGLLIIAHVYGNVPCSVGGMTCDISGGPGGIGGTFGNNGTDGSPGQAWIYKVGAQ